MQTGLGMGMGIQLTKIKFHVNGSIRHARDADVTPERAAILHGLKPCTVLSKSVAWKRFHGNVYE